MILLGKGHSTQVN